MVNLPGTRPEMVTVDFEGVSEALKGQRRIKALHDEFLLFLVFLCLFKKVFPGPMTGWFFCVCVFFFVQV